MQLVPGLARKQALEIGFRARHALAAAQAPALGQAMDVGIDGKGVSGALRLPHSCGVAIVLNLEATGRCPAALARIAPLARTARDRPRHGPRFY